MRAFFLSVALFTALPAQSQVPGSADLLGEWWTPGFGARVLIEPCGDAVCGRIVWVWDESANIADKAPLVGRKVIEGMRVAKPDHWNGGKLYNPEDGNHYRGSLQLRTPTSLLVEGCVLMLCKQQVWRRADVTRCPPVGASRPGTQTH